MRKIAFIPLVLIVLFAAPMVAGADRAASPNGCLVVSNGQGVVNVVARGTIRGRIDSGRIIVDEVGDDSLQVFGATRIRDLGVRTTLYIGENLRFQLLDGNFRVRIVAVGIQLQTASRGYAVLSGENFSNPGEFSIDRQSWCDRSTYRSMPATATRFQLGSSSAFGSGDKGK